MSRHMTFSRFRQSTAIYILSVSLGSVPSLAQSANAPSTNAPSTNERPTNAKTTADTQPVQGKVVEDIVARVNDQIITSSDYDRAAEQLTAEAGQQAIPAHELEQKKADLLRDLIDQQLLLSKGKELGITGETELIKRLDEIRKQNHLESMEDLEKAASQQGVSYEDFKANIRNGIITQQVVRDEVGRKISMSPGEVQAFFKAHESEFAQPESVTLSEIMIPTPQRRLPKGWMPLRSQPRRPKPRRSKRNYRPGQNSRTWPSLHPPIPTARRASCWANFAAECWARNLKTRPSP